MKINEINRKSLKSLPERNWQEETICRSILLVPSGLKHESGYMRIAVVAVLEDDKFLVCAYPDDINWKVDYFAKGLLRTDCFYPSGVLRFHGFGIEFKIGEALSSTDIFVNLKGK